MLDNRRNLFYSKQFDKNHIHTNFIETHHFNNIYHKEPYKYINVNNTVNISIIELNNKILQTNYDNIKNKFLSNIKKYIEIDDIDMIKNICIRCPDIINELDYSGNTLFHHILIFKKYDMFGIIFNICMESKKEDGKYYLNPSIKNKDGNTYIHLILFNMLEELERWKKIYESDANYSFMASIQIIDNYLNIVNNLMNLKADIYIENNEGITICELLLNIDLEYKDNDNLFISLLKQHKWNSAKVILNIGGFDINYQNKYGNTALHIITNIINNNYYIGKISDIILFDLIVLLLRSGANDKIKNNFNIYPNIKF